MNLWTKKSIELANQSDYLDMLYKVYPMSANLKRELSQAKYDELKGLFDTHNHIDLIKFCLEQELFPIKDSYVAYLRRDSSALARNPNTVSRLAGMLYELGINEIVDKMVAPKETNRQLGPLFKNWLDTGALGAKLTNNPIEFLEYSDNCILSRSDLGLKQFAEEYLGYSRNKGLDFIAKFNDKFIIAEAKFLTDFGGHQNAQLDDALRTLKDPLEVVNNNVVKIAVLDGVLYIPNKGKMHKVLQSLADDEVVISALLLRDFLYSL